MQEAADRQRSVPLSESLAWWMEQFDDGWSVSDLAARIGTTHQRVYRHLRVLGVTPRTSSCVDRWLAARTRADGACLLWTGASPHGRPMGRSGKSVRRIVWEHTHGPIPDNSWVVRIPACEHHTCVAVTHLRLVTPQDHIDERVHTLKFRWGENHGGAKLTEEQARHILNNPQAPATELAALHGVTPVTVRAIRARRRWAHLTTHPEHQP